MQNSYIYEIRKKSLPINDIFLEFQPNNNCSNQFIIQASQFILKFINPKTNHILCRA